MQDRITWNDGEERLFDGRVALYNQSLAYFIKPDGGRIYIPLFSVRTIEEIKCGD